MHWLRRVVANADHVVHDRGIDAEAHILFDADSDDEAAALTIIGASIGSSSTVMRSRVRVTIAANILTSLSIGRSANAQASVPGSES